MRAEAEVAAFGEWAIAARAASNGLQSDPRLFAAIGDPSGANTKIPSEGGWAVPPEIAPGIERDMLEQGEISSRVDTRTITGDSIAYTHVDVTSMVDGKTPGRYPALLDRPRDRRREESDHACQAGVQTQENRSLELLHR